MLPDRITNDVLGLVFPVRIWLTGSRFRSPGEITLQVLVPDYSGVPTSGLSVDEKIKTGKRSIFLNFLSPAARKDFEARRER